MNAETRRRRALRSTADQAVLRRLREEFPLEYRVIFTALGIVQGRTQTASRRLRQEHTARAAEIYDEELRARGLPEVTR